MEAQTDWLQRGRIFVDAPCHADPGEAREIISGLVAELSLTRGASAGPAAGDGAPLADRTHEWVEGIMTAHRPSHVKAVTNAMMRTVNREGADQASLLVASAWATAAALRGHPDPAAAVSAICVIVLARMLKIAEEQAATAVVTPPAPLRRADA